MAAPGTDLEETVIAFDDLVRADHRCRKRRLSRSSSGSSPFAI